MKTRFTLLASLALVALALPAAPALSQSGGVKENQKYTIGVEGTPGVKLRMLLVAKPSATGAPTRESKTITIPFETTFEAAAFYVWFDTLEGGKDGDRFTSIYKIDGDHQGGGFGGTIRGNNKHTFGFGTL